MISTLQNYQSWVIVIISAGLIYWLIKEAYQEIKIQKERVSELLGKEKGLRIESDKVREKLINMLRKAPAGEVYGVFLLSNNITEQVEAKNALEETLDEKKVLLSELYHRVKNNLSIVIGLSELQNDDILDSKAIAALQKSQTRIHTIAEVHELLNGKQSLKEIPFRDFIHGLMDRVFDSFDKTRPELHLFVSNLCFLVWLKISIRMWKSWAYNLIYRNRRILHYRLKSSLQIRKAFSPSEEHLERMLIELLLKQLDAEFSTSQLRKSSEVLIKFTKKDYEKGTHDNFGKEFILHSLLENNIQVAWFRLI